MYVCLCVEKVMMECVVLLKDEEMLEGACQAIAHTTTTHTKREETNTDSAANFILLTYIYK